MINLTDFRPSESETDNGKADLADYDEEEIEKPKKKEETKSKKTSKDQEKSKKLYETTPFLVRIS